MREEMTHAYTRLAGRLDQGAAGLHALDYEDLTISKHAMRVIRLAAKDVLTSYAPPMAGGELSLSRAVALFIDHIYWDETNGDLLMCSDLAGRCFCLPIPKGHWWVRTAGRVH